MKPERRLAIPALQQAINIATYTFLPAAHGNISAQHWDQTHGPPRYANTWLLTQTYETDLSDFPEMEYTDISNLAKPSHENGWEHSDDGLLTMRSPLAPNHDISIISTSTMSYKSSYTPTVSTKTSNPSNTNHQLGALLQLTPRQLRTIIQP